MDPARFVLLNLAHCRALAAGERTAQLNGTRRQHQT
jgi:hypothetical protein